MLAGNPGSLQCAFNTLRKEIFQFRFDYPLQIVPEGAEKNSLHYHLYGDSLAWKAMRLDANGIPRAWGRTTGAVYRPPYVAWYGLVQLGHFLRHGSEENLGAFLKQVAWLEANAVRRDDGATVWPMNFDYPNGLITLKAPWVSAYAQGLAISAMVRGWRLTKRRELMELLKDSAKVFQLEVKDGGVRVLFDGHVLYTEIPGAPPPGILDGFLTSLLGLYDLHLETGDEEVGCLFEEGIEGLMYALPKWDYRQKWSWYGSRAYLSPPSYHILNCLLLRVLARISKQPVLAEYANRWNPSRLSKLDRGEIYLGFLLTKNRNRIRYRTWHDRTLRTNAANSPVPHAITAVGACK